MTLSISWRWYCTAALICLGTEGLAAQSARTRTLVRVDPKVIGGISAEGDALLNPYMMVTSDSLIYVYDGGDRSVKCFTRGGIKRWQFGRGGNGPGEFVTPFDMKLDRSGRLWITDINAARLTVVGADGKLERTIVVGRYIGRLHIASPTEALVQLPPLHFMARIGFDGQIIDTVPAPPELAGLNFMVSDYRVTPAPGGGAALVFEWSDIVLLLDQRGRWSGSFHGIEAQPFPQTVRNPVTGPEGRVVLNRVDPKAAAAARAATVRGDKLYVLYQGRSEEAGRLVDVYRLPDGMYVHSLVLPVDALEIGFIGKDLAVLVNDPAPAVLILTAVGL